MFVGWVCTRDLDVDSQKALCWLVLVAEEFERLVASITEVPGAWLPYAGRICKALATNTQVTDWFGGEAAMSLDGE